MRLPDEKLASKTKRIERIHCPSVYLDCQIWEKIYSVSGFPITISILLCVYKCVNAFGCVFVGTFSSTVLRRRSASYRKHS